MYVDKPKPVAMSDMGKVSTHFMHEKKSVGGLVFYEDEDEDKISENNYRDKALSDKACDRFKNLTGRADFLDVGAGIGSWSIPLAKCLRDLAHGGMVVAVEPNPRRAPFL